MMTRTLRGHHTLFQKNISHNYHNIYIKLCYMFYLLPSYSIPLSIESTLDRGNVVLVSPPIILWTLGWGSD
jgi:hypothetical protein